jgi:leucyl aminopeptidase
MEIKFKEGTPETHSDEAIVISVYENDYNSVQKYDAGNIKTLFEKKEFCGELFTLRLLPSNNKIPSRNILLAGLGKREELDAEKLRKASALASRALRDNNYKSFTLSIPEEIQAVTEGAILGLYQFTKYKTNKEKIKEADTVTVLGKKEDEYLFNKGKILAESQNYVRDLVNEPGSTLVPREFADRAKSEAEKHGIKVTILDKKKITELGMSALLAVNKGSYEEPRFIILEYKGGTKGPYALVGKGITFDSGGLDIKLSPFMETMKCDMAGGATVLATTIAAAKLKLPVHIYTLVASTDNMPSGNAYKTGDIITAYNKKTIEIINTDAEGRVILADALSYAVTLKPKCIVDLATLTGACVVALGSITAGILGNNQELMNAIQKAGEQTNERVWPFPLYDEYKEQVKSEIADVRNLGIIQKEAGAIMGAAFLEHFVDKTPWAHLDIAGPAWSNESKFYSNKGGTGFGVRLLVKWLEEQK